MTFIYIFLPIVCILCWLSKDELHNYILLIASILFYAWGEPNYLVIMLFIILTNYYGAICINRTRNFIHRKIILFISILLDISCLFYFKYFNFIVENINVLLSTHIKFINIVMPIGISFYTFQAMSYLIDVYRDEVKVQKDIYKLALYICLFPQLIAGPIVKYRDIGELIESREIKFEKVVYGFKRFIIGLSKKMLLANTLGEIADKIFNQPVEQFDCIISWIGAFAYTFQLFYDFSGYSDMAIGLGSIFGFKFLENFNYPYISKSITEFWRRWHISLSTWFKEYLYIPLGGNRVNKKRNYFNLLIVFFATGIWHGASWNFVLWGLWHGMFIIFEKITAFEKVKDGIKIRFLQHIYTIFVVIIGWIMFRAENMNYAWNYIKNMFGLIKNHQEIYKFVYYIDNIQITVFIVAFICAMPTFRDMLRIKYRYRIQHALVNVWIIALFVISTAAIAASTYNPFIYFRF